MMSDEVSTPFRIVIPSGQATFNVKVPKHHLTSDRKFYFNHLHVAPDFYNKEAEKLQLDADPEMDKMINYPVQVKVEYKDIGSVYGPNFKNSTTVNQTQDAIEKINDHYEHYKPDFCYTSPFFIDWIDTAVHEDMDPKKYVPMLAKSYYNEYFREVLHGDRLPSSVRSLDGVNNYLPPIGTMVVPDLFEQRIRLRIWMAPYTRAVFSSNLPFVNEFGFGAGQFGEPFKNQYHLVNKSDHWLPVLTSERAPSKIIASKIDFRMAVAAYNTPNVNRLLITNMSRRDWQHDEKVIVYLRELFKQASTNFNVIFSLTYSLDEKRFAFHFPTSDEVNVSISCLPEFAMRLGYGPEHFITKGMKAQPQQERQSYIAAQTKALAVVYDTGPIICTLDNVSSNTTSGADDQFMAALYPHMSGTLSMPQSLCSCRTNAAHINILTQSTAAFIPITFRLLRIYDDEKSSNFSWTQDAYVYGVLQGFCDVKRKL